MKLISFVIPCYNSAKTIEHVIEEINHVINKKNTYEFEIVCVVDGSPDNVYDILKQIASSRDNVKIISLSKNFGQANARMAAFNYVKGDYVVCLDDDGQCPVDKLYELLEPLSNGYDISVADYPKKKQSLFKNIGSKLNKAMSRTVLDVPKDFRMTNFFAVKKYVVNQIINYTNPYPYFSGLLSQITKNIAYITMEERPRLSGKTGYTFSKLLSLWINGYTAFSVKPLRISSFIGIICAFFGFVFGLITVIRKLFVPNISVGWSSTVSIMLFIGGLVMLMLGMIGEYVGRIYISINNSPQYVVKETINIHGEGED